LKRYHFTTPFFNCDRVCIFKWCSQLSFVLFENRFYNDWIAVIINSLYLVYISSLYPLYIYVYIYLYIFLKGHPSLLISILLITSIVPEIIDEL
jgi:hypothetical protein